MCPVKKVTKTMSSTRPMKTSLALAGRLAGWIIAVVGLSPAANGAMSVGANGINNTNTIIDFSVAPVVGDWNTGNFAGVGGGPNAATDLATMLAAFQAQSVSAFTVAPPITNPADYTSSASFKYQQPDQRLSSATGSGTSNVLVATLVNSSGFPIVSFDPVYTFGIVSAGSDDYPGFGFFYSATGLAGSWVAVGQHTTAGAISSTITPAGTWLNGTNLYLAWTDDNSQNNPDGAYTLDNFQVQNVVVPEPGRAGLLLIGLAAFWGRRRRL